MSVVLETVNQSSISGRIPIVYSGHHHQCDLDLLFVACCLGFILTSIASQLFFFISYIPPINDLGRSKRWDKTVPHICLPKMRSCMTGLSLIPTTSGQGQRITSKALEKYLGFRGTEWDLRVPTHIYPCFLTHKTVTLEKGILPRKQHQIRNLPDLLLISRTSPPLRNCHEVFCSRPQL